MGFDVPDLAVVADDPVFDPELVAGILRRLVDDLDLHPVLGMHQRGPGPEGAVEILGPHAVDLEHALVPVDLAGARVHVPHAAAGGAQGQLEPLHGGVQLLPLFPFGRDVAIQADDAQGISAFIPLEVTSAFDVPLHPTQGPDDAVFLVKAGDLAGDEVGVDLPGACMLLGMRAAQPAFRAAIKFTLRQAVELEHARIPALAAGAQVRLPHPVTGGQHGQLEPFVQLLQLLLRFAVLRDVGQHHDEIDRHPRFIPHRLDVDDLPVGPAVLGGAEDLLITRAAAHESLLNLPEARGPGLGAAQEVQRQAPRHLGKGVARHVFPGLVDPLDAALRVSDDHAAGRVAGHQ